ncbi:MAG: sulfite exporter TauE/SafE family protein [Alphaproteobacteria bacterium]|nr:sulfite exporter TauE/SafE family protein [Alphaproteobacteria bacterium]MBV8406324.1 sulfite exporter TauE/SafE family protein [Alphaproteobacteria bacterium]
MALPDASVTFAIGILAGVMSVLAGGGVTVVLPVLLALGLSADQANATSRFNLVVGGIIATIVLIRSKKVDWRATKSLLLATVIGAVIGTSLGLMVRSTAMFAIIVATSVVSLILVFVQPNRWLSKGSTRHLLSERTGAVTYGLLCAYGGVVAVDSAILRLIVMVLFMGIPLNKANPIKVVTGLALFAISCALYGDAGKIDWTVAAWLAGGTAIGAAVASRFTASEEARHAVYRLLQVSVTVETLLLLAQALGWLPHM